MDSIRGKRPVALWVKLAAAGIVVAIAQTIVHQDSEIGGVLGLLALALLAALVVARPVVRRHGPSRIALAAAAFYALVLIDDPNPLALLLFMTAASLATLLPQRRFGHALLWLPRLAWHALTAVPRPWRDLAWSGAARTRRGGAGGIRMAATMLVVPVLGGAVFLTLFANANPVIGTAFAHVALPDLGTVVWRTLFAAIVLIATWATLRPRLPVTVIGDRMGGGRGRADIGVASLILSLATFNAIFAVQNVLDIAFLWSGAALPAGVTLAEYAHRGAYALIVTALLAALFVLVALRPGGAGFASRPVRVLVAAWIGQNLLLVASSALRLFDYIDAYSMTTLRLASLLWMALVATGLGLILWRLLRARSATWLINANALAAALVLSGASAIDLGATAAAWNARVAIERGRAGPRLDLCYLGQLGSSGLTALATLERHARSASLRDRIAYLRGNTQGDMRTIQTDWRSWTGRNARRLASVARQQAVARRIPGWRDCDGVIHPAPARPAAAAPPAPTARLTKGAER